MPRKRRKPTLDEIEAMAEIRRSLTAADLARMLQPTPTVPLKDVITELEAEYKKQSTLGNKTTPKKPRRKSA